MAWGNCPHKSDLSGAVASREPCSASVAIFEASGRPLPLLRRTYYTMIASATTAVQSAATWKHERSTPAKKTLFSGTRSAILAKTFGVPTLKSATQTV
jgi:hypothetical protein